MLNHKLMIQIKSEIIKVKIKKKKQLFIYNFLHFHINDLYIILRMFDLHNYLLLLILTLNYCSDMFIIIKKD